MPFLCIQLYKITTLSVISKSTVQQSGKAEIDRLYSQIAKRSTFLYVFILELNKIKAGSQCSNMQSYCISRHKN